MENNFNKANKEELAEIGKSLYDLQQVIKEKELPVLIILEGYSAAGKGNVIGKILKYLDPRFYDVYTFNDKTTLKSYPFLYPYYKAIPSQGKISIFDSSYLNRLLGYKIKGDNNEKIETYINNIVDFENQLSNNGYLVIKFFLNISHKTQEHRLKLLQSKKSTKWRVKKWDLWQVENRDKCEIFYNELLRKTHHSQSPWIMVDNNDFNGSFIVMKEIVKGIEKRLTAGNKFLKEQVNIKDLTNNVSIKDIKYSDKIIDEETYKIRLKELQKELKELHNKIYIKKIPVTIVYEGVDAAGKGGNIMRLCQGLDPRGFKVNPTSAPTKEELSKDYLWRFWINAPKAGHIAIFDRSWYGRVLVERIEGFCSTEQWKNAYSEINRFEKELVNANGNNNGIVIKFWVQIDKDTQLKRFKERESIPDKNWKITDEDWRNREKWEQYEKACEEMLRKTSTTYGKWYILESIDKKYARIKALEIVVKELKEKLKEKK